MSPNTVEHNPRDDQPPHGHPDTQPAQTSADLVNMLAARTGHFRLESGHHGSLWLDLDRLLLRPYALQPFARELAQRLSAHTIQAVCGPMTGGAFVAQFIAADLDVECYYAERTTHHERNGLYPVDYRLPDALRDEVRGKRIAVVDDAINAGSAVRGTVADLPSLRRDTRCVGSVADPRLPRGRLRLQHAPPARAHRSAPKRLLGTR